MVINKIVERQRYIIGFKIVKRLKIFFKCNRCEIKCYAINNRLLGLVESIVQDKN